MAGRDEVLRVERRGRVTSSSMRIALVTALLLTACSRGSSVAGDASGASDVDARGAHDKDANDAASPLAAGDAAIPFTDLPEEEPPRALRRGSAHAPDEARRRARSCPERERHPRPFRRRSAPGDGPPSRPARDWKTGAPSEQREAGRPEPDRIPRRCERDGALDQRASPRRDYAPGAPVRDGSASRRRDRPLPLRRADEARRGAHVGGRRRPVRRADALRATSLRCDLGRVVARTWLGRRDVVSWRCPRAAADGGRA